MNNFTIIPARYRKGHVVIQVAKDGSGFKTALHIAVEHLGGKWVHRYRGYVLSEKKAALAARFLRRVDRYRKDVSSFAVRRAA